MRWQDLYEASRPARVCRHLYLAVPSGCDPSAFRIRSFAALGWQPRSLMERPTNDQRPTIYSTNAHSTQPRRGARPPARRRLRARPVRPGARQALGPEAARRHVRHPQRLRAGQHHGDGDQRGRGAGGRQVRHRPRQHPGAAEDGHQSADQVRDQHPPPRRPQRQQRQDAGAWACRWWRRSRRASTWWTATSRACRTSRIDGHASLFLGGKRVDLYQFGRAHTSGDVVVLFPAQRVLAAGDMFTVGADTPQLVDYPGGGSAKEWPATVDGVLTARLRHGGAGPRHGGGQGRDADVPRRPPSA